jgi:hypothetical protein
MPAVDIEKTPEEIPAPRNEIVEKFREDIELWFVRFQLFYDAKNAQTRNYRLAHVDLITDIYNNLMEIFGDDIEGIRQLAYELNDLVDAQVESVGSVNECIQEVMDGREANSARVGATIQQCANMANQTLSSRLSSTFYPAHASIQRQISTIPLAVIDVLSRGNVLQDEGEMIQFLSDLYEVKDMQWEGAVSQLLRWESNRWTVDGEFMVDEMRVCVAAALTDFIVATAPLEIQIRTC